jgi:flagellar assembly protein FliH
MRLLSNIIKSGHVFMNLEDAKVIKSDEKINQLFLININKQNEISDEFAVTEEGTFQEGLNALVIDQTSEEYIEKFQTELERQREEILDNARKEAELIITKAQIDSQRTSEYLYEDAKKRGYEDGMLKAASQTQATKRQYDDLANKLKDDYTEQIAILEPEFCNILIELLKKITGVIVEDKKDIILYLIHNAILHADNCKTFIIRTSKEDYDLVASKKEELLELIQSESVGIDIVADKELNKNQCFIDTESSIIECSLDVQLNGLIQDIKLLSTQTDNFTRSGIV